MTHQCWQLVQPGTLRNIESVSLQWGMTQLGIGLTQDPSTSHKQCLVNHKLNTSSVLCLSLAMMCLTCLASSSNIYDTSHYEAHCKMSYPAFLQVPAARWMFRPNKNIVKYCVDFYGFIIGPWVPRNPEPSQFQSVNRLQTMCWQLQICDCPNNMSTTEGPTTSLCGWYDLKGKWYTSLKIALVIIF